MPQDTKTKSDLERELVERRESIERRIDVLEDEIASTPTAITSAIARHPLVGIAGAIAAGLAISLLLSVRRRRSRGASVHQELVEKYIDYIGDDVKRKTRRGKSAAEAVRESLRDRAPVIFYSPTVGETAQPRRGIFRQIGDVALTTALGFVVKTAVDFATASLNVKELQQMLALEGEERHAAEAGAAAAANGTFEEQPGWEGSAGDPR